jgi:hypothetical protein
MDSIKHVLRIDILIRDLKKISPVNTHKVLINSQSVKTLKQN